MATPDSDVAGGWFRGDPHVIAAMKEHARHLQVQDSMSLTTRVKNARTRIAARRLINARRFTCRAPQYNSRSTLQSPSTPAAADNLADSVCTVWASPDGSTEPPTPELQPEGSARALKRFERLDTDGSGSLEGDEIRDLAEWVWTSFNPESSTLTDEQKTEHAQTLLGRLDVDGDGVMSFDEFSGWFERTCSAIETYRSGLANRDKYKRAAVSSPRFQTSDTQSEGTFDMSRARARFKQLDADANGVLEGDELVGLAQWVWSSFHPGGDPLSDEQKVEEGAKLLHRLDENGDGALSFDEFADWFRSTCQRIEKYRSGVAHDAVSKRLESERIAILARTVNTEFLALNRAQKKFDQLDIDKNGTLEGDELISLAEWVWSRFHPGGDPLSDEQKVEEGAKLLEKLDENGDGVLSFDEFADWFRGTCHSIENSHPGLAQEGPKAPSAGCIVESDNHQKDSAAAVVEQGPLVSMASTVRSLSVPIDVSTAGCGLAAGTPAKPYQEKSLELLRALRKEQRASPSSRSQSPIYSKSPQQNEQPLDVSDLSRAKGADQRQQQNKSQQNDEQSKSQQSKSEFNRTRTASDGVEEDAFDSEMHEWELEQVAKRAAVQSNLRKLRQFEQQTSWQRGSLPRPAAAVMQVDKGVNKRSANVRAERNAINSTVISRPRVTRVRDHASVAMAARGFTLSVLSPVRRRPDPIWSQKLLRS